MSFWFLGKNETKCELCRRDLEPDGSTLCGSCADAIVRLLGAANRTEREHTCHELYGVGPVAGARAA